MQSSAFDEDPYPSTDEESDTEEATVLIEEIKEPQVPLKSRKLHRSSLQQIIGTFWSQTSHLHHRMSLPEIAPLLQHSRSSSNESESPVARFRRKIVPEGTIIIVYPIASLTRSTPLQFSSDLPETLLDTLPAPLYRSHIHELNQFLELAHSKKRGLYKTVGFLWILTILSLWITSLSLAWIYEEYMWSIILSLVSLGCVLLKPYLTRLWISRVVASMESHIYKMVDEWNARAPNFLQFNILLGTTFTHRRDIEQANTPEFHILVLDAPRDKNYLDWDNASPPVSRTETLINVQESL